MCQVDLVYQFSLFLFFLKTILFSFIMYVCAEFLRPENMLKLYYV